MAILKKKKGLIKKTVIDIPAIEGIVENAQMSGLGGLIFRIDSMPGVDLDYPKGFRLEKGDHVIIYRDPGDFLYCTADGSRISIQGIQIISPDGKEITFQTNKPEYYYEE